MNNITKIRRLFDKGLTPKEIVAKGYNSSQVYAEFKRREAGEPVKPRGRPKANPIEKTTITVRGLKNSPDKTWEIDKANLTHLLPDHEEYGKPLFFPNTNSDPINPDHYKIGGIETADFIEAKKLGYNLGNVIKYVSRADHKGERIEDLKKAQWYLEREIAKGNEA